MKNAIHDAVSAGKLTSQDAEASLKFLGSKHHVSVTQYVLATQGLRPDLASDEDFLATERAFSAIGFTPSLSQLTAEPFESQFWTSFDSQFSLSEIEMREKLPLFISDPSNRTQVEALMEEKTKQLTA